MTATLAPGPGGRIRAAERPRRGCLMTLLNDGELKISDWLVSVHFYILSVCIKIFLSLYNSENNHHLSGVAAANTGRSSKLHRDCLVIVP